MNYLKLMSILSEADADEYGVATQKKKKDEKDDFHRSKADQAFKDMHKVDVATEKDFETLGPITTKQHDDHKGNPSAINIGDATQQSPLKQFDMGGIGKSSYRKIDKTEGQKAMPKVDDGATKVLRIKEEAEIDEAVGTAAKYAHKKGIFGGKYGAKDHALAVSDKTAKKYLDRSRTRDKAEHEKQDPRMAKMGYAKHMVDAQKAKKKAKERGVTMPKLKGVNYAEEIEQLDELSPKTLNSYATKAQPDIRRQSLDAAKRKRRAKGVALARFKALRGSK